MNMWMYSPRLFKLNHDDNVSLIINIHAVIDACMNELFPVCTTVKCDTAEDTLTHYVVWESCGSGVGVQLHIILHSKSHPSSLKSIPHFILSPVNQCVEWLGTRRKGKRSLII